jgi:hypothetical protein
MRPSMIRTLSTGNTRKNFTITIIGRSIGILHLPARGARHTQTGFKEMIEEKSEISLGAGNQDALKRNSPRKRGEINNRFNDDH